MTVFSRKRAAGATLIFQLPGHIPAGEVKVRGFRNAGAKHFGAGRRLKRVLMAVVEVHALLRRRHSPQQRPERATMHHAEAVVIGRLKCQRVDIIPPDRCFAGWHQSIIGVAPRQLPPLVF